MYKQGNHVHVFSYHWIPQSVLYGAFAVALATVGEPVVALDQLHLTSATPNCQVCGRPTAFTKPGVAECPDHGEAKPKTALICNVRMNRQARALWVWYEGNPSPDRRAAPRTIHAIAPGSVFSFLAYAETEQACRSLFKALKVLCYTVNGEEGAMMCIGKHRSKMGLFSASTRRFKVKPLGKVNGFGRAQSPMPFIISGWKAADAAVCYPQIRHIHYVPERFTLKALLEGSGVQIEGEAYTSDVPGVSLVFRGEYRRVMASKRAKAIEPAVALGIDADAPSELGTPSPFTAPVTHPVVGEARLRALEEFEAGEPVEERARELEALMKAVGVRGYSWKEIADALTGKEPLKSSGKCCVFCGAPAKFITNLHRLSSAFLPPPRERGMWVFDPTAVTADFWTNKPQGSKNRFGVCPACLYALARWKPAVRREVSKEVPV